jgi:hypothetical protein
MNFDWAVYSFSNGHFSSAVETSNLPFTICLACNSTERGRSLFHKFASAATVFGSGNDLLTHIRESGDQSTISGYLINSYQFQTSKVTSKFWKLQLSIIALYDSSVHYQLSLPLSFTTMMAVASKCSCEVLKLHTG